MIRRPFPRRNRQEGIHQHVDEGPDLVLYYKYILVLLGDSDFEHHFNETDKLSDSQRHYAEEQLKIFKNWWANWGGQR